MFVARSFCQAAFRRTSQAVLGGGGLPRQAQAVFAPGSFLAPRQASSGSPFFSSAAVAGGFGSSSNSMLILGAQPEQALEQSRDGGSGGNNQNGGGGGRRGGAPLPSPSIGLSRVGGSLAIILAEYLLIDDDDPDR